jgi:hypothetical protein
MSNEHRDGSLKEVRPSQASFPVTHLAVKLEDDPASIEKHSLKRINHDASA